MTVSLNKQKFLKLSEYSIISQEPFGVGFEVKQLDKVVLSKKKMSLFQKQSEFTRLHTRAGDKIYSSPSYFPFRSFMYNYQSITALETFSTHIQKEYYPNTYGEFHLLTPGSPLIMFLQCTFKEQLRRHISSYLDRHK